MNRVFYLFIFFAILSLLNNYFMTSDEYTLLLSELGIRKYINIIQCNSIKDYLDILVSNIYYWLFFLSLKDLNTINEVMR